MSRNAAALLLLADGRFPAGGYAHSGGLEPAVAAGLVGDLADVERHLSGRLETVGAVVASFAAAACHSAHHGDAVRLGELDAALDARMPSPAARDTSRQLGRQLLRVVSTLRADDRFDLLDRRPHQPLVLGVAAAVLGLAPRDAALAALHEAAAGVVAAAVRLLSLDPLATHGLLARSGERIDELADAAATRCAEDVSLLPAFAAPLLDLVAEQHARRSGRLFAS